MALCIVGAIAAWASPSHALGVLVSQNSDSNIEASRTVIAKTTGNDVFQMTEIDFDSADRGAFIWVLPVPAEGEEVTVVPCEDFRFDELAKLAQPRILLRQREDDQGCGGSGVPLPVETKIGAHEYSQNISVPEPRTHAPFETVEDLQSWLLIIGDYVLAPSNRGVLAHYVASTYHFVAVEVSAEVSTGRICVELGYSLPAQREYDYLLPMKRGSVTSGVDDPITTEILLYALDEGTVRPLTSQDGAGAYRATTINVHEITATGPSSTSYETVFDAAVGDPPGFVVEYSGQLNEPLAWTGSQGLWLTRLRTQMTPSELTGPDLALQSDDPHDVPRDYSIVIAQAGHRRDISLALCAVALVGVLAARRRARSA